MTDESEIIQALSSSIHAYNSYFQHILGTDNEGGWKKSNKDHHCFIPTHGVEGITRSLHYVRKLNDIDSCSPIKFLDCGCGIGNIMVIAHHLGFKPYGIEYEKENVELARKLLRNAIRPKQVIHGDLMKYENYKKYDVIYYYEPLKKNEKRRDFADKIAKDAKCGALVIPNGLWENGSPRKGWKRIKGLNAYKKL